MRVIVSKDVFTKTDNISKLHRLINHACQRRHFILVDPPSALDEWLNRLDPDTNSAYGYAVMQMIRSSSALPANMATVFIKHGITAKWDDPTSELPIDDALAVLDEPLKIYLENVENDWNFLLGIMRVTEREQITESVRKGWVKPFHGSGTSLNPQLLRLSRIHHEFLRAFVMFDSDRRHPDELETDWSPIKPENCAGYDIEKSVKTLLPTRYWMLNRRFIESYMPKSRMLKAVSGNISSEMVEAFFRLNLHGRWYYNMKGGFEKDEEKNNAHRCKLLYDDVSVDDRKLLRSGFHGTFANQYEASVSEQFDWDDDARLEADDAIPRLMRLL